MKYPRKAAPKTDTTYGVQKNKNLIIWYTPQLGIVYHTQTQLSQNSISLRLLSCMEIEILLDAMCYRSNNVSTV